MAAQVANLPSSIGYEGELGVAVWEGHVVEDAAAFRAFLRGPVAARVHDVEALQGFEEELRALASTGLESTFLQHFLAAVPPIRSSEVGEAVAESMLAHDAGREVTWPWNERRDRRTPQASLPGADLVGFCRDERGVRLLFGEVKTSSEAVAPPSVMTGRSGMAWQLEHNATRLDLHHALLRWLAARCVAPTLRALYREAVSRYLRSEGRDILIVGVLLRDTPCDERDVAGRARYLAGRLSGPTRAEVLAWYLPLPIEAWVDALQGEP